MAERALTATRPFRASILARARLVEDLVGEQVARGLGQYVILGPGLDTFAQRRPERVPDPGRDLRTLRQVAALTPGSRLVMSFMLPIERANPELRPGVERAAAGARASGTPFISFFTPPEMLALAREAGFRDVQHVSADALADRYFTSRADSFKSSTPRRWRHLGS